MSASSSRARKQGEQPVADLGQLDAMAQMAREANVIVHVVLPRAAGVVEHARETAQKLGLECYSDIRLGSIRIRFTP